MPSSTSKRPTALVVEDEALISLSLEEMLSDEGYRVVTARTVDQALATIRSEPITIALVDYWLETQGAEPVVAELEARGTPFAICTGSMPEDVLRRLPGTIVIGKPFEPGALEALTRRLAGVAATRAARRSGARLRPR
jgi:DNA-binding NtrC family response regulator